MDSVQNNIEPLDLDKRAFQVFSDFMTRIITFDELVSVGSEFLAGFHKHLDFLHKTSEVIDGVNNLIKSVKADVKTKCVNVYDGKQSVSKSKELLNELECIVDVGLELMRTAIENKPKFSISHSGDGLVVHYPELEEEEIAHRLTPSFSEYVAMMGSIYLMVKQDYAMQEKIFSSLDIISSSEELQSYCDMWSLRPYVNEDIMRQAWRYIP